ncbi:uncharacterized protein LOC113754514 isoform X2 [Coffea eugenioides]|uniref:Uncharacterized protein isoform X1 n=1 Tax=Coffea arabica TaxID=13443 RepID=A0A6P6WD65_COFAR|nr:uncharacterized protein LOC113731090 isoform X2 [Coffea arabica]XP_027154770.1 uncharacterized protein LOC113754514 isoform X2 [Coffea eugenioides]
MASHQKKESIALLSIYGDEDDEEMEEAEAEAETEAKTEEEAEQQPFQILQVEQERGEEFSVTENPSTIVIRENTSTTIVASDLVVEEQERHEQQQRVGEDNVTPGRGVFGGLGGSASATPQGSASSPGRRRKERITIVDYGHDEAAMSPEPEEGEIMVGLNSMEVEGAALVNGNFQVKTVQVLTPGDRATPPQVSDPYDQAEMDTSNPAVVGSESAEAADADVVPSKEAEDIDLLNNFLPRPPEAKCSDELQEKISKFLRLKKIKSYNAEVRNRKEYRNPDFLRHAMIYLDIDEIGSCFSKDVFDPHGYNQSDFYDEIELDMRREMERKEQERKRSPKIDFLSAGTQPGAVPTPKINLPISVAPGTGLNTVTAAVDTLARDGRQNKKSKWDKVDGDRFNLVPTVGQDAVSAVATHASFLSAANAGTGYSAYAQQRRREAEDKRSSDKKSDRSSDKKSDRRT